MHSQQILVVSLKYAIYHMRFWGFGEKEVYSHAVWGLAKDSYMNPVLIPNEKKYTFILMSLAKKSGLKFCAKVEWMANQLTSDHMGLNKTSWGSIHWRKLGDLLVAGIWAPFPIHSKAAYI